MKPLLRWLRRELGLLGLTSLGLLLAVAAFWMVSVKPLEERLQRLDRQLEGAPRDAPRFTLVGARTPAAKLAVFYRFFERSENQVEWLAKIYGIAAAAGLELRAGDYRFVESKQRIERYQITLPIAGSYSQLRTFLENALVELPIMSLDQVNLRRKGVSDTRVEADVVFTLHLLRE